MALREAETMAKNDNGNSTDFYELLRRHQQYQEAEAARRCAPACAFSYIAKNEDCGLRLS